MPLLGGAGPLERSELTIASHSVRRVSPLARSNLTDAVHEASVALREPPANVIHLTFRLTGRR
jgi:hypothetical protein